MVTNRIIFFATSVQPNPEEIDYWVDLSDNPYGGNIKYFNGTEWVRLAASGGTPDLSNYYTKTQINNLLNNKADVGDVDSKVDDEEVKDVIKDIQFNTSNPNDITMVMFKYDGSNKTVSIPVASTSSADIITSKDFLDFVKQHQLQELHTEMIDTFADIRAKYQKKLIAGLNIEIDQETNVTSALGVDPTTTYVKKAGDAMTGALTNSSTISGSKLISTVSTGTAPIQVSSTTLCTNLNADMVDGYGVSNFNTDSVSIKRSINSVNQSNAENWIKLCTLPLTSQVTTQDKRVVFEIVGGTDVGEKYAYCATLTASTRVTENVELRILNSVDTISIATFIAGYVITSDKVEIWIRTSNQWGANTNIVCKYASTNADDILSSPATTQRPSNFVLGNIKTLDAPDWYGVSWSETSSNPDCTRIGNMDMHRTLPIQSMMKPFSFQTLSWYKEQYVPLQEDFVNSYYNHNTNISSGQVSNASNTMIKIPEFWYTDDYVPSTKTHNLKLCPHAKPGWYHHKEAYVSAYEVYKNDDRLISVKGQLPTVNFNRTDGRTWARANGFDGEAKWNLYTYEEHRAICHLFLVEYATRNSQKAVNTQLTPEGFRQGGLGSGCTTGIATINGAQTWSFIPTGSSDSLGSGSGEVTVTIQQTDSSGSNTSTITRKCNRYRGIENPFGHIWKHTDDIISVYNGDYRTWYKSMKPDQFSTNKNTSYKPLCSSTMVSGGYKTEIKATPTCDFFAMSVSGGSENTYWCDYNWDNTDASEHCLLIGGRSDNGGAAGLFDLYSDHGVGSSAAHIGSRLTYLPWAE